LFCHSTLYAEPKVQTLGERAKQKTVNGASPLDQGDVQVLWVAGRPSSEEIRLITREKVSNFGKKHRRPFLFVETWQELVDLFPFARELERRGNRQNLDSTVCELWARVACQKTVDMLIREGFGTVYRCLRVPIHDVNLNWLPPFLGCDILL
jgi:hypothetical protein